MAKAFAIDRATGQPITIDTVSAASVNLGVVGIAGMETTSLFPARCVNLTTVLNYAPAYLTLNTSGNIIVYLLVTGLWAPAAVFTPAIGHVLAPICLHVVNDQIVAIWSDDDGGGNVQFSAATSFDGITWTAADSTAGIAGASTGGHSILYRGSIWFATSLGLWAYAPLARFMTLGVVAGTFSPGETVTGSISLTTAVVQSFNNPILRVDTVSGTGFVPGETISSASGSAPLTSFTRSVNTTPDTGDDTFLGAAGYGTANLIGSFASWGDRLYFAQPKTASNPIRLYRLESAWESTDSVPVPQWANIAFSGIVDAGFGAVAADSGVWALFVNRTDELCLFYSGSGSTKLAKTSSKTLPLVFTDLTNSLLPTTISTKSSMGITLYTDDRRRDNILQTFIIRDLSAGALILASWDGVGAVVEVGNLTGSAYMLPASRMGQETTFTNIQPSIDITGVALPFPGRVRIDYTLYASPARTLGIIPEYSLDGDQYYAMTEGAEDSGVEDLPATPSGDAYFFNWDTFADLDGDLDNVLLRIVARISGV